jgi:hypothetical protein
MPILDPFYLGVSLKISQDLEVEICHFQKIQE